MRSRGTATDRLSDVVQVLQLAHKTGLLVVNRDGLDNSLEEGTIQFHNGQIVDARIGQIRGAVALERLLNWTCYFVFHPTSPKQAPPSVPDFTLNNGIAPVYQHSREPPQLSAREYIIPYRMQDANDVLLRFHQLGLSRAHRQLFILIDGRRPLAEFVRLMGYGPDEILAMLADLERAGLIRQ